MGLAAELNVCGNRAADLSRANQAESSEAGLEVNSITKKEREQEWTGEKDLLCREEKEPYKSYLIRNSDGVSPMRKTLILLSEPVDNIKLDSNIDK